jgi:beta-xylosidase
VFPPLLITSHILGANTSNPILATGHGDFVQTPAGDWYMVFLGIRPQNPENSQGHQQLGRETFLAPVEWIDGWPVVNGGNFITFDMPGLYDLARPEIWRDDFNGQKLLDKAYYTQRTPYKQFYSLTERHGYLRLRGNPYTLSDRETPAALFRKQVDLETTFSTVLDFQPTTSRQEAGITVFLSIHYHNDISIMLHPDDTSKRVVVVQTRTGTDAALNKTYYDIPSNGPIGLFIDAKKDGYSLGYSVGDSDPVYVAHVENRWLQAWLQGWQNFVGTHFGVYATGNILSSLAPAVSRTVVLG